MTTPSPPLNNPEYNNAPPVGGAKVFTNDPVRISWIVFTFVQSIIAVLLLAQAISEVTGGIIVGITAAAYVAVSELFVRPETVPRKPLEELAASTHNP